MKEESKKDSRIAYINLLSDGYVIVHDKDGNHIEDLAGVWSEEKEAHLREVTPDGIEFGSWGILPYAKEAIDQGEKMKKRNDKKNG